MGFGLAFTLATLRMRFVLGNRPKASSPR